MFNGINPLYAVLAGILLLLSSFTYGYYAGYQHEKNKFETFVAETKTNALVQEALTKQIETEQKAVTENIVKGWNDDSKKLRSYYASHPNIKWMLNTNPTGGQLSDNAKSPEGIDAKAEVNSINTTGINPLDCASDVLQLLTLQKWLTEQHLAN